LKDAAVLDSIQKLTEGKTEPTFILIALLVVGFLSWRTIHSTTIVPNQAARRERVAKAQAAALEKERLDAELEREQARAKAQAEVLRIQAETRAMAVLADAHESLASTNRRTAEATERIAEGNQAVVSCVRELIKQNREGHEAQRLMHNDILACNANVEKLLADRRGGESVPSG
jgi:NhaP-type Na+/H+ and K+/H+ antiporter